jgi:hypothetical protein
LKWVYQGCQMVCMFSYQKCQFWYILKGLKMENFVAFHDTLMFLLTLGMFYGILYTYIFIAISDFFPFWFVVPRKIWQPWVTYFMLLSNHENFNCQNKLRRYIRLSLLKGSLLLFKVTKIWLKCIFCLANFCKWKLITVHNLILLTVAQHTKMRDGVFFACLGVWERL